MLLPVFDMDAADSPSEDWDLFDTGVEKPTIMTRTSSGVILMWFFGSVIMLVMLNLLIAIMSSTYEAALDNATVQFKVYKVRRIVEYRRAPRFPGPFYFMEIALYLPLGWMMRKLGKCKGEDSWPFVDAGWSTRSAFTWDKPEWKPEPEMLEAAKAALATAKDDLRGGWESTTKAAKASVRRMQQRHGGGVATSKGVHSIIKVEVGEVHAALDAKHVELNTALNTKVAALENKLDEQKAQLDAIMELLEKK